MFFPSLALFFPDLFKLNCSNWENTDLKDESPSNRPLHHGARWAVTELHRKDSHGDDYGRIIAQGPSL